MLNQITLIGNVGQDPDIFNSPEGWSTARFNMATTRTWKDRNGNQQKDTTWHTLAISGGLVKVVEQYVKKGDLLAVTGELLKREYNNRDGVKVIEAYVRVDKLKMLSSKRRDDSGPLPPPTYDAEVVGDDLPF